MVRVNRRGEEIRKFILENVEQHGGEIVRITSEKYEISRQAVSKHVNLLVKQNALSVSGKTKSRAYFLCPTEEKTLFYKTREVSEEHIVWRDDIGPLIDKLPDNIIRLWQYCFTEMFNNAIDHSGGNYILVVLVKTAIATEISIHDDGEGIFHKIKRVLGLDDEKHALLELAKGKLTTDPKNHTGEGIFFTSRMTDRFAILSGETYFSHKRDQDYDWIMDRKDPKSSTMVTMRINNNTSRTTSRVFRKFTHSNDDEFGFNKTIFPVELVRYGDEMLVSRSQAKRLLSRIDKFKLVLLDFNGVDTIGQAFADEIFRVYALEHPGIEIHPINANKDVEQMIVRALLNR